MLLSFRLSVSVSVAYCMCNILLFQRLIKLVETVLSSQSNVAVWRECTFFISLDAMHLISPWHSCSSMSKIIIYLRLIIDEDSIEDMKAYENRSCSTQIYCKQNEPFVQHIVCTVKNAVSNGNNGGGCVMSCRDLLFSSAKGFDTGIPIFALDFAIPTHAMQLVAYRILQTSPSLFPLLGHSLTHSLDWIAWNCFESLQA